MTFDIQQTFLFKIRNIDNLMRQVSIKMFKPFEIAPEQYGVLDFLIRSGNPLSIGELAQMIFRDKSTMTRMVDSLLKKNLVEKTDSDKDKRMVYVVFTKKGLDIHAQISNLIQEQLLMFEQTLEVSEKENLMATLNKIEKYIKERP